MENDLETEIFNLLKKRFDTTPSTKEGHLADMHENDLITGLGIGRTHASKDDVLKAVISLSKTGKIYLDDSDGGTPNYERGGANHHYRYRILDEESGVTLASASNVEVSSKESWIIKDRKTGDYFYDGNKVSIRSKDSQYAKIFDAVFSLVPQGGEVSYENIIKQCDARRLKIDKKAIQKALTGKDANFFRYVKTIPLQVGYGEVVFQAKNNGTGLIFNNKH
jgi:hypothetical protein